MSYALNVQRSTVNGGLYSLGRERETTVTLNLNIPLGKSYDAPLLNSYTSHSGAGGTNSGLSVGGSAGEDSLFNYSLGTSYNSRSGMSSANGNLDYLGSLAQVGASISQGRDYRQTSLRASGNVLAHAGGSRWRRSWATPSACCMRRTPRTRGPPATATAASMGGLWPGALSDAVSKQQRGTGFRRHGR